MSGPIVRTGATPEFWNNWDQIFGKKSKASSKPAAAAPAVDKKKKAPAEKGAALKPAAKPAAKTTTKAVAKKAAPKKALAAKPKKK